MELKVMVRRFIDAGVAGCPMAEKAGGRHRPTGEDHSGAKKACLWKGLWKG